MPQHNPPKPFKNPVEISEALFPDHATFIKKIDEIFESKQLSNNGPQVKLLNKKLKSYLGVNNISLFCNGALALELGIQALRLDGEVITTPFTFPASIHAITRNNLTPIFCDIDPKTCTIDISHIESLITPRTSAILGVHLFGNPCDVLAIDTIAKKHHLKVIYDAAHAFKVEVRGVPIGNFGDITMFSFHPKKCFNTIEGGALTFQNHRLDKTLALLRMFGITEKKGVVLPGTNAKMNEVQAAFGLAVLKKVQNEIIKRKRLTQLYRKNIDRIPGLSYMNDMQDITHNYIYFPVFVSEEYGVSRDQLHHILRSYNICSKKTYNTIGNKYECYQDSEFTSSKKLSVSEKIANQIIFFPLHGELREQDIDTICTILRYKKKYQSK